MTKIQEIAERFLTRPLRIMVVEINQFLPDDKKSRYTHQALQTWTDGSRKPDYFRMLYLSAFSEGWVKDFANEVMDVLREERRGRETPN